jgi:hypothetical protein
MSPALLPERFAELEPFAATWCLASEPERWERRLAASFEELQTFYDACFPRAEEALAHCDQFELGSLPPDAVHLLEMLHSLALVSYAIEVWGQQEPIDMGAAVIDRTREPRIG